MYKNIFTIIMTLSILFGLLLVPAPVQAEIVCTPTGYYRDNINLTAAYINPTALTGEVDATGCHIGVYFDTTEGSPVLENVDIYGASYFGVLVNAASGDVAVNITKSKIHHIGDDPFGVDGTAFSGAQHGVAIYYAGLDGHVVKGSVQGNIVYAYQKGGIAVNGDHAYVTVLDNIVTGLGPIDFIAQNGIQFGWEAKGEISGNTVSGNYYSIGCTGKGIGSCTWISAGILLYDPDPIVWRDGKALKATNELFDNQIDVYIYYVH